MNHLHFDPLADPVPPAPVDPQLLEFLRLTAAEAAKYPRRDTLPIAAGRANSENVRLIWAQGGPQMDRTEDFELPTRHGPVRARLHYPKTRAVPGIMLYIHGGGFVLFSIDTHDRIMREYAERTGIVVMGIDYTLAPGAQFPRPLDECVDAVHWISKNANRLDIDPDQIFVGGDSAGATLTVGACITFRDAGLPLVAGMVLNYGGYGDYVNSPSVIRYGAGEYGLSLHMMTWFRLLYINPARTDPRANPIDARLEGLPPAWMVITECDPLYDKNVEMARRLRSAGVDVQDKVYAGTVHSFLEAVSISDIAGQAFDDTTRWLVAHSRA